MSSGWVYSELLSTSNAEFQIRNPLQETRGAEHVVATKWVINWQDVSLDLPSLLTPSSSPPSLWVSTFRRSALGINTDQ